VLGACWSCTDVDLQAAPRLLAATARGRRSPLPDLSASGSLEPDLLGPRSLLLPSPWRLPPMPTSRFPATCKTSIPDRASSRAGRGRISSSRSTRRSPTPRPSSANFGEMVESENYVQPQLDFDLG